MLYFDRIGVSKGTDVNKKSVILVTIDISIIIYFYNTSISIIDVVIS